MGPVEFHDRRGEGRLLRAEDKAKKTPRATKAQYEKHLADSDQEEQRVAEVRTRQGQNMTMSGDEYDAWKADQPKGSHRVTFRTVVRKKS
jgi:hypothetical protein